MSYYTHFITHGAGMPVILLHGVAASSRDWDGLVPVLARAGYQAYAPDLLGHGSSAKPGGRTSYSAESIFDHFKDWIGELQLESAPVLVGHSLGGYLGLSYAIHYPDRIKGLILINPFYTPSQLPHRLRLLRWKPEWGEKALSLAPLWLIRLASALEPVDARHCSPNARRQAAEDYKRASPSIAYIPASLPDLTSRLEELTLKVRVIWGEKDLTLNPHSFRKLVARLPNASAHAIRSRGHKPHLSSPNEIHCLILEYLAAVHTPIQGHPR